MSNETKKFAPPTVGLGDTVLWKHARDDGEEAAAIVVKVGNSGALGLVVFAPDTVRGLSMDGVLHIDDPRNAGRQSEAGVWRRTDRDQRIDTMLGILGGSVELSDLDLKVFTDNMQ